jgi:hypothetical protein
LPLLLSQEKKYDLGFIDGWHTFDHTLIDFFYLNRLIDVGGIIIIDDINLPAINKLMRYILKYPAYQVIGKVSSGVSKKRKMIDSLVKPPFRAFSKFLPDKIKYEIFSSTVVNKDQELNLRSSVIALKKIKPDQRSWNWFEDF